MKGVFSGKYDLHSSTQLAISQVLETTRVYHASPPTLERPLPQTNDSTINQGSVCFGNVGSNTIYGIGNIQQITDSAKNCKGAEERMNGREYTPEEKKARIATWNSTMWLPLIHIQVPATKNVLMDMEGVMNNRGFFITEPGKHLETRAYSHDAKKASKTDAPEVAWC